MKSQFHYGSIQIKYIQQKYRTGYHVSIPLWFDSNEQYGIKYFTLQKVSIPLWFDSNPKGITFTFCLCEWSQFHYGSIQINNNCIKRTWNLPVSIPLWFDSNSRDSILHTHSLKSLNSTMVRFKYKELRSGEIPLIDCLNSTMVRFKWNSGNWNKRFKR